MDTSLNYVYSAATAIAGRISNQDNFSVCGSMPFTSSDEDCRIAEIQADKFPAVFAVCDGIGSYKNSDETARLTLDILNNESKKISKEMDYEEWTRQAIRTIQTEVDRFLNENEKDGGNTIAFLVLNENQYLFANIGDSPAFILKKGADIIEELSVRHNLATYNYLTGKPVNANDSRYLIYSIGANSYDLSQVVNIELNYLNPGDSFLICSDGISNILNEKEITQLLLEKASAEDFVSRAACVEDADNCTAIAVYVSDC